VSLHAGHLYGSHSPPDMGSAREGGQRGAVAGKTRQAERRRSAAGEAALALRLRKGGSSAPARGQAGRRRPTADDAANQGDTGRKFPHLGSKVRSRWPSTHSVSISCATFAGLL
jgi:hypothetical protein